MKKAGIKKAKKHSIEWLKAVGYAFLITWFIRLFLVQGFFIPSASMEQTLLTGDFIFINKLAYGARLPITPLSVPFIHQYWPMSDAKRAYFDLISLPYWRVPGYSKIKAGDVVVFNYPLEKEHPIDKRTYFVKRCVGLPGDSIHVQEKTIFAGGELLEWPENAQKMYYIKANHLIPISLLDSLNITEGGLISNTFDYNLPLSDKQVDFFHQLSYVHTVMPAKSSPKEFKEYIYPHHPKFPFNEQYFGPVLIPAKGTTIALNDSIIWLYKTCIEMHENKKVELVGQSVYIDGKEEKEYTFENDYYFMMGDNRDYSNDSRTWGFVPESHIVGRASVVFFSTRHAASWKQKIRWNRIFKFID